ncbi:MAG: tetratricopeptide repeat protein [Chitinispirillaceae bacterium]|nr:tetratricopeptide repeat protein [Chitinispirillaceae bacterium]
MQKMNRTLVILLTVLFAAVTVAPVTTYAAKRDDERKRKIEQKLKELEEKKQKLRERAIKDVEKNRISGKSLDEVINRWEKLLDNCESGKKSLRCADAMYNLGSLYYEKSRDEFIKAREAYERAMDEYEKNPSGPEPVNPLPDYAKSLAMYESLARDYPEFNKVSEAYYQMGNIYLLMGDIDGCKKVFTKIVDDFPQSPRASMAHFKLSDLCYLDHNTTCAIKHLEKVKEKEVDLQTWEMVHYRKGEVYYNRGDFDKAIDLFFTYIERCDNGMYKKREFREMALEFMAISFSDMPNGAEEAIRYFNRHGHKPYEAQVMYTIGMKNRIHGQWEDAIKSLTTTLNKYPYYKDAPLARQMLIECFVVKKDYEKANKERVRLVDDYGPGSKWYSKNQGEKAVIEQSRNEIKKAIGSIAIYYHALAQKKKDKSLFEKALKRYQEFFKEFPDDMWRTYEYEYNVAEIYNALGDCEKAAEYYERVAEKDISKFPEYKAEIDTLGMDQDEVEKLRKKSDKGPILISQEDAGYNVIVALDVCRKKSIARKGITEEKAYLLPETRKLLDYAEKYHTRFPKSSNAPEVLYLAGNIHYSAKQYDNAIRVFKQISESYPSSKMADKGLRMLANSYSSMGQFEQAMSMYRLLIEKQKPNSPEQMEVIDLAAGAMYKRAESIEKKGDKLLAAEAYQKISEQFPTSKVADRGWFQAGVCFEKMKNYDKAAELFEGLPSKFPKSTLREKAFLRAADNYKTLKNYERAAQVYQTGANTVTRAEFAIPSLSSASECFQKLEQFEMAGKMFEIIYERYSNDPKTPQALYNAGLMFEKGKLYSNAINVYFTLSKRFPESEYAAEAFFSVGLCYEKMGQYGDMASVFAEYAQKFSADRYKQVQARVKAGNAYLNMGNFNEAEKNYLMAVSVYEKFHKSSDMDVGNVAEAYYKIGEIYFKKFSQIKLEAKNVRQMRDKVKEKTKVLEESAKNYAKAIEIGVEEWTIKATYMIGQGFVDMAEAVSNQTLFGSAEQRIGSKVKILSSLDKYYQKAQEYFYKNIEWAHNQDIGGEYVDKSIDKFMEMLFRKGDIMEEVGRILKNAPLPKGLSPEEQEAYRQVLEEKWLEAIDAALPRYEEAVRAAKDLGIAQNQWLDRIKERITEINPNSEVLAFEIKQWEPKPKPVQEQAGSEDAVGSGEERDISASYSDLDPQTGREMQRIQNIMNMEIPASDKIKQLNRIEMEARRNIELEEGRIRELKEKL